MRPSAFQAVLANSVRTPSAMLIATTCDELRPLALSADAASGNASMDFRSDCNFSSLVCETAAVSRERAAIMTDVVKLCMVIPSVRQAAKSPIHEIWLGSDSDVANQ